MTNTILHKRNSLNGQGTNTQTKREDFLSKDQKRKPYRALNEITIGDHVVRLDTGDDLKIVSTVDKTFSVGTILFRIIDPKDKTKSKFIKIVGISPEHYKQRLEKLGYFTRKDNNEYIFILERSNIIKKVHINEIKKDYYEKFINPITEISLSLDDRKFEFSKVEVINIYHNYQRGMFGESFYVHLQEHTKPILRDDRDCSYICFSNCVLKISRDKIEVLDYQQIKKYCIWEEHIIKRQFQLKDDLENIECHFKEFIKNVCNDETDRYEAMLSAIGYLLHNYNNPSGGQVVIAYDEQIAKKGEPSGGTGKGLF
ncbi:MAG: hypothetical protein ACOCUV_03830, partial [bacterium]